MLENQQEGRISAQEKQVQEIDEKTSTVKNFFFQKIMSRIKWRENLFREHSVIRNLEIPN
jgi:hypothetical protein